MIRSAAVAAALVAGLAASAQAQAARCDFPNTPQTRTYGTRLPSGQYNYFQGGGVRVVCASKGITIRADSLEYYGDEGRIFLIRNVSYDEPRFAVTSQYLTYFLQQERIIATENVNARMPSGSTLTGPQVEYLRDAPRVRTQAQVRAVLRPTARILQPDSAGRPQPPVTVVANTLFMAGDSLLYGSGRVEMAREGVIARGDSVFMNSAAETMRLMRGPVVEGQRDRPFRLTGTVIDLYGVHRKADRIVSRGAAVANSEDMNLRADTIDLRITDDELSRAIAWGRGRASAVSPTQTITADSIDAHLPGQRLRRVYALGAAAAEGRTDSTRFQADTTDWLRGDTITADFDSTVAPGDTARSPRLRQIVAVGSARSYQHVPASDAAERRPAISYVLGRRIVVTFAEGQVATVNVTGNARGVFTEPVRTEATTPPGQQRPGAPASSVPIPARPTPARP